MCIKKDDSPGDLAYRQEGFTSLFQLSIIGGRVIMMTVMMMILDSTLVMRLDSDQLEQESDRCGPWWARVATCVDELVRFIPHPTLFFTLSPKNPILPRRSPNDRDPR